mmetsp:Transcript_6503/g.19744  ORF Transcript_6503/g.19744 Transcript_6503/m.19744 type:complete len:290 (+) Transcript_6503:138-1007(+)|eukprot:CAMPEP_0198737982 /NCGR_PEP_ID=MMETSP1475-20131203/68144_1 /TAXON_ID= ORGANISM="Unidentified sp., Strain CCMP1999" /NCGR_SAMPLE_ID=MMETSP1475 /ASSEMBLY_ACC=CAM_ASM_001111 /LENGTH=289 /DNA_ID=CAMNT_0044501853 /DNA_START=954 /DNA_END=1823 /DNA_ORIENTATION=+
MEASANIQSFRVGLVSGAVAGSVVDLTLFPLDTIKTRLQAGSASQVHKAHLLTGVYRGVWPALIASAPAAATFFGTYDFVKSYLGNVQYMPETATHLAAAAAGDITSSAVRVPFEKVKQRLQAGLDRGTLAAFRQLLCSGGVRGLFSGYSTLVVRELPFDLIEFPLYEYLKKRLASSQRRSLHPHENALCGSAAGAVAAAVTTPLDVVKTRVMLQSNKNDGGLRSIQRTMAQVAREEGVRGLFAGILPRVAWISFGGFIFFGGYEYTKALLLKSDNARNSAVPNISTTN